MDTPASSPAIGGVSDPSNSVAVVVEKNKPSETTTKPDAVYVDVVPKEVNLRNGTAEKGTVDNNTPAPNVSDNRSGESETVAPTNDGPGNIEPNRGGDCDDTVKTVSLNNENDARVDSIGVEGQGDSASTAAAVASSSPTVSGGGGGVVSDSSNNTNNGLLPVGGDLKDLDQSTMSEGSGAAEEPMTTAIDIDSDTITSVTASTTEEVVVVSAGGPDSVVDDAIETQAKESATTDAQNNDNGVKGISLANEGTVTPLAPTVVVDCSGQPTTKSVISAEDNDDEPSPVEETNVADVEKATEVESPVAVDLPPTPPEVVVESVDVPPEDVPREEKKEIEEESSVQVMPEEDVPDEEESSLVISEVCTVEDSTNKPPVVSDDVELKLPIESVDTAEEEEEEDDCQEVDRDPDGQLGPLQLDDSQEEEAEEEEEEEDGVMLDDTVGDLGEEEENQIETIDIDTDDDEDDDGEDEDEEEEEEGDESSLVGPPVDDEDDDDVEEVESLGEEYEEFEVSDEENGEAGDKDMSEQSTSGDEARFAEMRASNRGAKRKLHGPAAAATSKTVQQSAAKERKVAW